jgi:hypothetical protein
MSLIRNGYAVSTRRGFLGGLFSALLALALFDPGAATAQEVKQIKLTEKHLQLPVREAASISRSASIAVSRNFPNSESMAARSSPSQAASTFRSIAAVGSLWSGRSPTLPSRSRAGVSR